VLWLIIANVAVHFVNVLSTRWLPFGLTRILGLSLDGISHLYFWQPLTYMFAHSVTRDVIWHLVFNMIMLYFIGSEVERFLGRDRFLEFYATCGLVGGVAYLGLSALIPGYYTIPLVGASGAIYGLLLAAMIFFPQMQIILLFFPIPIRVFGMLLAAILLLQVVSPGGVQNLGGEVCHIGGAATGVAIFYAWGMLPGRGGSSGHRSPWTFLRRGDRGVTSSGAWARKQQKTAESEAEVDRILAKVHAQGIQSLTRKEKKILAQATRRSQERERASGRIDRL
jgi:membrane associated rhomboid family serine protease